MSWLRVFGMAPDKCCFWGFAEFSRECERGEGLRDTIKKSKKILIIDKGDRADSYYRGNLVGRVKKKN